MTPIEQFFWGFFGSIAVEIVPLCFLEAHKLRTVLRQKEYWLVRLVLGVIAGGVVVAYAIQEPSLAIFVGAATPLILTRHYAALQGAGNDHDAHRDLQP